jgi:hypothetical protein
MPSAPQSTNHATRLLARTAHNRPPAVAAAHEIVDHTRGHIRGLSGLALRAQANSLPGLACQLLAGSQPVKD